MDPDGPIKVQKAKKVMPQSGQPKNLDVGAVLLRPLRACRPGFEPRGLRPFELDACRPVKGNWVSHLPGSGSAGV